MDAKKDAKWGCSKCGGRFVLSNNHGRTAAKYGMRPKCMCEEVIENYHKMKFGWYKIQCTIPFLLVWFGYRHFYIKKMENSK